MMQSAAQAAGDVQVALIPFANGVNVGTGNVNEPWLDWSHYSTSGGSGWGSSSSSDSSWDSSRSSSSSSYSSGSWSSSADRDWSSSSDKSKWQGCVMDRDQDNDVKNTTPKTGTKSTLFPALYSKYCPAPIVPLTNNWTALTNRIDSMIAVGSTNQTIGMAWAWQALTAGEPVDNPAMPTDAKLVIVILSDGLNTENRWTTDGSKVDARMKKVCDNVKAANITVYAVQVNTGSDPTSTVLKDCASSAEKFFVLTSANQMVATFNTIGTKLTALRLSK